MHLLQDDTLRGLLHGIYVGVSGILLKPLSGSLSLLSELCMGASGRIRTWGEEFHRGPPSTRKRPPRQFSALTTDMRGASAVSSSEKLKSVSCQPVCCHLGVSHENGSTKVEHITCERIGCASLQHLPQVPREGIHLHAGDSLQHRQTLERLRKGRYSGNVIMDYLENKATKAVYITQQHVIYVSLDRHAVRWALSLRHLFSVTTAGVATLAALSALRCQMKGAGP